MTEHYLKLVKDAQVAKPVSEIRVGTLFLGNPKCPVGELPAYSASMGEGLWVRTPRGVVSVEGRGYDGQEPVRGWVVDGYVEIGSDLLAIAVRFKKQFTDMWFFAEQQQREIERLRRRVMELESK